MLTKQGYEETIFSFSQAAPEPPERRSEPRHLTILRVGALIGPGGRELCLIRNISAGGLMAHVYTSHEHDERVSVELKTNQQVAGTIIWTGDSSVGVRFDEPVDVAELLSAQTMLPKGWRPRLPRVEVDRLATLRCGARVQGVNTRDISQGGVKIETDQPLDPDAEIVLEMERFRPVHGVIRWCRDGLAGIAFNELIPFPELMAWLKPAAEKKTG